MSHTAINLDGKALAQRVRAQVGERARTFASAHGRAPGLTVILVGEDHASQVYVRNKARAAAEAGLTGDIIRLPAETPQETIAARIHALNEDETVDGILLQLPLPAPLAAEPLVQAIAPAKDVDGFTYAAAGRVFLGTRRTGGASISHTPCTPLGCMRLIAEAEQQLGRLDEGRPLDLSGRRAVVIGRSATVGLPLAALLVHANATVTLAHSRTSDLAATCREADILAAAVGRAGLVRGDWVKSGAVVIDVGINRAADGGLVGDVAFDEAKTIAAAITPVPGGVGPMTVACLLSNTVDAAEARAFVASG